MDEKAININNLNIEIESFVLGIDKLTLKKGSVLCLAGPNGSGKTTLLKCICGLLPYSGQILIFNSDPKLLDIRKKIAYVSQRPNLLRGNVYENISYPLKIRGYKKNEIKDKVIKLVSKFNIENLLYKNISKLSGGEARKVSFARAVAYDPQILLLDEPLNDLDSKSAKFIFEDIKKVIKDKSITTVYATHNNEEILNIGSKMLFIDEGKLIQTGPVTEVFNSPVNKKVANYLGTKNIIKSEVVSNDDGLAKVKLGNNDVFVTSKINEGRVYLCLRPEDVFIGTKKFEDLSARNIIKGRIKNIHKNGSFVNLEIDCGVKINAYITNQSVIEMNLEKEKQINIYFKATAAHLIKINNVRSEI